MKRSWMGFALLLVLMAAGFGATWAMGRIHEPVAAQLRQAEADAALGDWDDAEGAFRKAWSQWEKWEHFRACFADHSPVEEIDAGFAALGVYCASREELTFRAACLDLAQQIDAVGEAHGMYWWNLL